MKKILLLPIFIAITALSSVFLIFQVQAAASDSSINLSETEFQLFVFTITDPDGILEFSITPSGKLPYGGLLAGCPTSYDNNLTLLPEDFLPSIQAYIIDCANNTTKLEIPAPVNGVSESKIEKKEEAPAPVVKEPASAKATAGKEKVEKKPTELTLSDVQYPVKELGGCTGEQECRTYCDASIHAKECFAFAKKYNLISEQEQKEAADRFLNVNKGPGGCSSGASCESYCNNVDRLDECIAFAEESGYYSPDELAEARKFQELVRAGKQFPGGCKDRNGCEVYCNDASHMEECLDFAEESGFLPKEEIAQARKMMEFMRRGETPGGCTSKEQCEKYCFEEENMDECIAFADKAGLLSKEEREMIKKTGGKGPGGCRSKNQCDAYCSENQEECFNFAKENGLISDEDLSRMKKGMERFKEELDKMPPEAVQCIKDAVGESNFNNMLEGKPMFDRTLEGKMKSCFAQMTKGVSQQLQNIPPEAAQCIKDAVGEEGLQKLQSGELGEDLDFESLESCFQQLEQSFGGGGNFGGGGFNGGPGGCKSTDECIQYCTGHPEDCQGFGGPPGGGPPAGGGGFPGGPGGCTSEEECVTYCTEHPEECGGGGGGGGGSPVAQSCVPVLSGLISWWRGDTAEDYFGENNGTIIGGVNIASGEVGNAFKFDGSSGYINMGNPANLNFGTGPFSLEAWFNWTGEGAGQVVNNIIRKSNYGPDAGSGYWLRIGQQLEFSVGATTQSDGQSIITTPISAREWHHAVATKDSLGRIQLYVDGQSQGTILRQAANSQSTSGSSFTIGAWNDQRSEFFHGLIDEVSVYNRALSESEARSLFEAGSAGKCSSLSGGQEQFDYTQFCPQFALVPSCSFLGGPGSQSYDLCKQCFPDK
ncbi:MAG: LamG domain-containing protein [Candidatus Nealsonbacteria bacterium]|nr:LamG domain-containing protein [Candidatus Nealsonbacteria bacterium]